MLDGNSISLGRKSGNILGRLNHVGIQYEGDSPQARHSALTRIQSWENFNLIFCSLQNCDKVDFYSVKSPGLCIMLWQATWTTQPLQSLFKSLHEKHFRSYVCPSNLSCHKCIFWLHRKRFRKGLVNKHSFFNCQLFMKMQERKKNVYFHKKLKHSLGVYSVCVCVYVFRGAAH